MPMDLRARRVRFSEFEADFVTGELLRNKASVHIQEKPFQVLAMLLERPGELVTRDELRRRLWEEDTFVSFDVGLNTAVKKLRDCLGDSAESPRYIETLPRRGYRFLGTVEPIPDGAEPDDPRQTGTTRVSAEEIRASISHSRRWMAFLVAVLLLGSIAIVSIMAANSRSAANRENLISSIAVLPLQNATGDASQEYLCDGITDSLITELAQLGVPRVISRQSSLRYKGSTKTTPEIARELNVDAVLEGTLIRSGDHVRISLQVFVGPGEHSIWARSFDRSLRDVLYLQADFASAFSSDMRRHFRSLEKTSSSAPRPMDVRAYEAYELGRFFWNKRDSESLVKSLGYFQQAIDLEPGNALSYAGVADAYSLLAYGVAANEHRIPPEEAAVKAEQAEMKALQLDNTLADAHAGLGFIRLNQKNFDQAERELNSAIRLNPSCANAYHWMALLFEKLGRPAEALDAIHHAHDLDPLSPNILRLQGEILSALNRTDEALSAYKQALSLAPNQLNLHISLGEYYSERGMYPEALAEYRKTAEITHESPQSKLMIACTLAAMGDRQGARDILKTVQPRASKEKTAFFVALVFNALGDRDSTFAWLERARKENALQGVVVDNFRFGAIRSDPRYQEWLKQVNSKPSS